MMPTITTLEPCDCTVRLLSITNACKSYAGEALFYGLMIGCIVGAVGVFVGLYLYDRE